MKGQMYSTHTHIPDIGQIGLIVTGIFGLILSVNSLLSGSVIGAGILLIASSFAFMCFTHVSMQRMKHSNDIES
jgi:hypothetical protein